MILHEAAAAALPLIATDACGATVHLLRDGGNGFVVRQGTEPLLQALLAFHHLAQSERGQFSDNSLRLALSWTPELQARHFARKIKELIER